MAHRIRALAGAGMAVAVGLLGWQTGFRGTHMAHAQAVKNMARVTIFDSNTTFDASGIEKQGYWGFGPEHIDVHQGDMIEFDSSASNSFSHTVVSITWSGSPDARTLDSGTAFNSSPTRADEIAPGGSWTLDTTNLKPGQYVYYCAMHPWMVGTFSVEAAGQ